MKRKPMNRLTVLLAVAMVLCQSKVYAVENTAASTESAAASVKDTSGATESTVAKIENTVKTTENITVPTERDEVISVILPVVEERDPFSFFIDPLHIFYNTFGNSGGDITVEEGTCLLFYNRDESEYTLSSQSDSLTIINKSTVPVEVTITAKLEDVNGISIMQEEMFEDRDVCDLYLALVDNEGNEQPLSEDGEVTVTVKLDRAPLDAYAYVFDEAAGEYQYVCQSGNVAFDTYSFGLKGACNEKGDWTGISGKPHVTISWNVEPVIPAGEESEEESAEKTDSISENTIPDEDVSEKDGQSTAEQAVDGDKKPKENAAVDGDEKLKENVTVDMAGSVSGNDRPDEKGSPVNDNLDSTYGGADLKDRSEDGSPADESK